mgnify:CR=1 FL=1
MILSFSESVVFSRRECCFGVVAHVISARSALKKANGHSEVMIPTMKKMVNTARNVFLVGVKFRLTLVAL